MATIPSPRGRATTRWPTAAVDDPIVEEPGDDAVADDAVDDPVVEGSDDEAVSSDEADDGSAVAEDGSQGEADGGVQGEADDGVDPADGGTDGTVAADTYSIALLVADAAALTPQELSLTAMLEGNGHTVTPFTVTVEPIVNAVNNPSIDLLLFSPSFEFSVLYHPAQPDSLPMLDMAKYSWYRRYVLPISDEIAGPRFSGTGRDLPGGLLRGRRCHRVERPGGRSRGGADGAPIRG